MDLAGFSCFILMGSDFIIIDVVNFNKKMNSLVLSKFSLVIKILSNIGVIRKEMIVY